jgi:hypothetical protein
MTRADWPPLIYPNCARCDRGKPWHDDGHADHAYFPADSQVMWPYGPAPQRDCVAGGAHEWQLIDLFKACEPPAPSFECAKCQYRWSRGWTKEEFHRILLRGAASHVYWGDGSGYPDEPPYAA